MKANFTGSSSRLSVVSILLNKPNAPLAYCRPLRGMGWLLAMRAAKAKLYVHAVSVSCMCIYIYIYVCACDNIHMYVHDCTHTHTPSHT